MADGREVTARRRGRPPATDSAETRRTLFDTARTLFAERGYDGVTNKEIAAASGLTAAALYHYVESKLDLYVAVDTDVQELIYERFQAAVASSSTFIGKLEAVLEAAADLNDVDATLAAFVGCVRIDMRRHADVAARLATPAREREQFFVALVDTGVETGEIAPGDRRLVAEFIRTILVGLTDSFPGSSQRHRNAIDGITALLRGTLIHPVPQTQPRTS